MKKFLKKFIFISVFLVSMMPINAEVQTDDVNISDVNINNRAWMYVHGKLINGPRNLLYTVNGGASAYTYNINNAVRNWMYTGVGDNPIYMYPVSSNSGTTLDRYIYIYILQIGQKMIQLQQQLISITKTKHRLIQKIIGGAKLLLTIITNTILVLIMML